jgi:hypothetical protein
MRSGPPLPCLVILSSCHKRPLGPGTGWGPHLSPALVSIAWRVCRMVWSANGCAGRHVVGFYWPVDGVSLCWRRRWDGRMRTREREPPVSRIERRRQGGDEEDATAHKTSRLTSLDDTQQHLSKPATGVVSALFSPIPRKKSDRAPGQFLRQHTRGRGVM